MSRMIVSGRPLKYAGRAMEVGEEFDATESDAKVLSTHGRAVIIADNQASKENSLFPHSTGTTRRRYRRRDMRVEG